jgi:hypothetical protein
MNRIQIFLLILITFYGCKSSDKANGIIDEAISFSGGGLFHENEVSFDFRKYRLTISENRSGFNYSRSYTDTLGKHVQVFSKNGLTYSINDSIIIPTEKKKNSIIEGINSQVYFNMLPYKLNDAAVIKKYQGIDRIKNKEYHKIHVSFQKEGGGVDYEDQFLYWFDIEDYSMDYLAYEFQVNDGGLRFREAFNSRSVKGIVFQDYNNYKPKNKIPLDSIVQYFKEGQLIKLSEIIINNISVTPQSF